ncbi:hypothetical protein M970_091670 [Encephalitozoon cuniculi EcunIII-L]|uniref:DUF2428 domain-containing protein n=1 Tax=Encephalitozoon cuniculi TaxID=6035 RepID=M1K5M1_ENCCN|nr:hypothetical protein ECU09_1670 [Encephalitozoon cuniculi]KMV65347.1 hypothetical protein M970_091670 [Encephalitozoon cuniculi EcunIII-L]
MDSCWNAKDLFLLALEVGNLHTIGYKEIMSMDLESGMEISCTRESGEEVRFGHLWRYKEEEAKTRFRLCLVEVQLGRCPKEAVDHLLLLLSGADKASQLAIFLMFYKLAVKYKVYDGRVLHKCKTHLHLIHLRRAVLKTLIAYSLNRVDLVFNEFTGEEVMEMNLLCPKDLSPADPDSIRAVKRLFSSMNKASFRYSKRILKSMDERFFVYLPDKLNSTGYSHLRELLGKLSPDRARSIIKIVGDESVARLFLPLKMHDPQRFFTYRSVEVRIESLRHIDGVGLMRRFLEVNQFIYSRSMLKLLIKYFRLWLKEKVEEKHKLRTMYLEVISPMLRSTNASRRVLGVYLMDSLVAEGIIEFPGCAQLLFDSDHEVRMIICKHSTKILLGLEEMSVKIESHQSHDVHGCVEYIKSCQSRWFVGHLKSVFDSHMKDFVSGKKSMEEISIYGLLNMLSETKEHDIITWVDIVYDCCFKRLSDVIHGQEDDSLIVYWKNMRECCSYYCGMVLSGNKALSARLVQVLLHINHLGVVLQVSQYLNMVFKNMAFEEDELLEIVEVSFNRIESCKAIVRRSGGIPLLFASILRSYPSILERILKRLLELVETGESSAKIHCLNILSRIIEDGCLNSKLPLQIEELFGIAFKCSRSNLWAIRNIGIEIFSNLVQKAFDRGPEGIVSMAHAGLRSLLRKELSLCRDKRDDVLAFLILHLYGRMRELNGEETEAVWRLSERGGVVGLKSRNICTKKEWKMPAQPRVKMVFNPKLSEGEVLLRVLILLDSEHVEERGMAESYMENVYGLSSYSEEYLKHYTVWRICRIGYQEAAAQRLREYSLNIERSLSCFFKDSPSNERFDLEHAISLMEMYRGQENLI